MFVGGQDKPHGTPLNSMALGTEGKNAFARYEEVMDDLIADAVAKAAFREAS